MLTNNQRDIVAGIFVMLKMMDIYEKEGVVDMRTAITLYQKWRDAVEDVDTAMENEDALDRSE